MPMFFLAEGCAAPVIAPKRVASTKRQGRCAIPTVEQLYQWAKQELRKGKGNLHVQHPVIVEEAIAAKVKNEADADGKRKTKVAWDSHEPEAYAEFHQVREQWMASAGNNPRSP